MPVDSIIVRARDQDRVSLLEPEAKEVCRAYGLPIPEFRFAIDKHQAVEFAEKIGFPIVMKIVSPDILHKTEAGGVLLNLTTIEDVEKGFSRIVSNVEAFMKSARIDGVLVQRMAPFGLEVIVGGLRDPQFGPVVMFGLGGIFTEVLNDVTFGLAPLDDSEAREMIRGIRGYRALTGFREHPPVDEGAIASAVVQVSKIMDENQQIGQIDLNPVMAYARGCSVVDARILLTSTHEAKNELTKNDGSNVTGNKASTSTNR